ncbi:MAG: TM2 domain-containing protein [Clostridia bacterium]|nr:TM2 domain-containing protein [Clostridia bacterium]
MNCKNCGAPLLPEGEYCTNCGTKKEDPKAAQFCTRCGSELTEGAAFCAQCGAPTNSSAAAPMKTESANCRSKLAAGLLGIFLGVFGVHNFYLGYTKKAVAQVILGTVGSIACGIGPIVSSIWGLVEGIQILTGTINKDGDGAPLGE